MARGPKKSKEEKLTEELNKVIASLDSLKEKKEKVLATFKEKELALKAKKQQIETELGDVKKTAIINLIADSSLSVDEIANAITNYKSNAQEVAATKEDFDDSVEEK